ncbi:metallophosphoesterase [Comamonas antarctica]|uniref:Metallophosphoesterase n=1 Tax=Comamonas antarctica TaxID=2743470 RepID=A0A6N1X1W1_9BURK|nr:metallophosphoesterase [Comamonas antarctica]QKV52022.1 metallophosphoesterase [Comamonas antarctica]
MDGVATPASIKLLHLSDLHLGLEQQDWMWPTFRSQFYEDLVSLHRRAGPWDVVIFSGDLTQRGSAAEFEKLTELLSGLWSQFKILGSDPKLVVVPGNHDLERPKEMDPTGRVMAQWWNDAAVRDDFWKSNSSVYRIAVSEWFKNFESWHERLSEVIPMAPFTRGLLPGDIAVTIEKGSQRLGIVGLNSAWLQNAGGDFQGRLCVHPRQLMEVTGDDPDAWGKKHDSCLLVTHHPVDWLHPEARKDWAAEIYTPGRFDAHLYGHMHEGRSITESISGGQSRISVQAASLFGLEHFGSDKVDRNHGYSVIQVPVKQGVRGIRIWPRTVNMRADGSRRLGADQNWTLVDDTYCDITFQAGAIVEAEFESSGSDSLDLTSGIKEVLMRLVRPGAVSEAHAAVRKSEQTLFLAALRETRKAWLVADWGLGGDEFIQCVQQQMLGRRGSIYYLDLHNYRNQEEVLQGLPERIGCGFAALCSGLSEEGEAILVLDEIDLSLDAGSSLTGGTLSLAQQIDGLVQVILDFCPELSVVVRSRLASNASSMRVVELGALDEADTAQYVSLHQKGSVHLASHDAVLRLHRHTDGIPSRIDSILRDLQIVGLKGLFELDSDVAGKHAESREASPALVRTIQALAASREDTDSRSFSLLKVLSMFPQGEQLFRVKRFFGARAFYPVHASRLLELNLVDVVTIKSLEEKYTFSEQGSALVVRRAAREFVVQSLSSVEHRTLSAKALALYFGDDWELRGIRPPTYLKFKDSQCDMREIGNACTMVLRATRAATETGKIENIRSALALATSFAAQLRAGDHFRSVAGLYEDLLQMHESAGSGLDLNPARIQYAKALRMIGEYARARDLLRQCEGSVTTKAQKQDVLLNLAFISESQDEDSAETVDLARRAERVDPKSNHGLQAKSIIIRNDDSYQLDRDNQLKKVQEDAVKRKAFILSNNLMIDRAETMVDAESKKLLLKNVIQTARREGDSYNLVRASLKLARIGLNESGVLTAEQISDCTRAYEYLYNQRIDNLFGICHGVLWDSFLANGDGENLLHLFRHSSLIWRLRGQMKVESKYVEKLLPVVGKQVGSGVLNADRKLLYFMTRSIQLASDMPAASLELQASRVV